MAIGEMLRAMMNVLRTFDETVSTCSRTFLRRASFRPVSRLVRCNQPNACGDRTNGQQRTSTIQQSN